MNRPERIETHARPQLREGEIRRIRAVSPGRQCSECRLRDRIKMRPIVAGTFDHYDLLSGEINAKIFEDHTVECLNPPTTNRNLNAIDR